MAKDDKFSICGVLFDVDKDMVRDGAKINVEGNKKKEHDAQEVRKPENCVQTSVKGEVEKDDREEKDSKSQEDK